MMTTENRVHFFETWVRYNDGRIVGGNKFKSAKNAKANLKKFCKIMNGSSGISVEAWKIIDLHTGETVEQIGNF